MARAPIPLTLRAPNPPPTFVGRKRESAQLVERLRDAPTTIIHGPESIGKRALALHVLHRSFKSRVDRSVYVHLAPDVPLALGVADALAPLQPSAARGVTDREELALEIAEASRIWVLVEGGLDPAWSLARLAARYARASRWIFLARDQPPEALLECALAVDGLPTEDLVELAGRWHPDLPEAERALVASVAKGSPWRLRGLVADRRDGHARGGEDDPGVAGVLGALLATSLALPAPLLYACTGATAAMLARLVDRGLIVEHPGGYVIPDSARALLGARPLPASAADRLVRALATSGELPLIAEAIRLALRSDVALAAELLAEHGARLFSTSGVLPLARQLLATSSPEVARWRLRAAVELGDADALRAWSGDVTGADRLLWAEGLVRIGKLAEAIQAATTPPTTAEGCLIAARAYGTLGDFAAGLAQIATLRTHAARPAALDAHASSLAARLAALAGDATRARDELAGLNEVEALPSPLALDVLLAIASASHELGDLARADLALDRLARRTDADPQGRFLERRAALLRAAVQLDRGRLDEAGQALAQLDEVTVQGSAHRPFLGLLAAQHALVRGDAADAVAAIDRAGAGIDDSHYLGAWAAALTERARILDPTIAPRAIPDALGLWPSVARLHRARVDLRAGRPVDAAPLADPPFEAWIAERALAWEQALVRGDAETAHGLAIAAADRSADLGFATWEAEAVAGMLDAAEVMRSERAQRSARARLVEIAHRLGIPAVPPLGEIATRLGIPAVPPLGEAATRLGISVARPLGELTNLELERIAAGPPSPLARRARWMLGSTRDADALDLVVCEASGPRRGHSLAGDADPWRPGWGIDRAARSVWRPDGVLVDLADKPQLWRLLLALVDTPAGLSKEALITQTWGGPYHPMHHDKRLQNAIHKIRRLIEADPARPTRIATTPDGYRIGLAEPARITLVP